MTHNDITRSCQEASIRTKIRMNIMMHEKKNAKAYQSGWLVQTDVDNRGHICSR